MNVQDHLYIRCRTQHNWESQGREGICVYEFAKIKNIMLLVIYSQVTFMFGEGNDKYIRSLSIAAVQKADECRATLSIWGSVDVLHYFYISYTIVNKQKKHPKNWKLVSIAVEFLFFRFFLSLCCFISFIYTRRSLFSDLLERIFP